MTNLRYSKGLIAGVLIASGLTAADSSKEPGKVLWRDPSDLERRDLLYGSGGKNDAPPAGPFQFLKEDLKGTNPKFTVRDASGVKWKIKLGAEARPETVATRLVWAAGYFTDEDYFVDRAEVSDVPSTGLHRLKGLMSTDSTVRNARFEREHKGKKKDGTWSWKTNQFSGTRELNGLRTLMALVNNWDVKDENNSIYDLHSEGHLYVVSDLGASFGTPNLVYGHANSKGNLEAFERSHFIAHKSSDRVDFACPGRPSWVFIFNPHEYFSRVKLEWIGRNIPRADAKWMGTVLGRLSPEQIRDAFRAAGYSKDQVEGFARVVEKRIAELNAL